MWKIPTVFERDPENPKLVLPKVNPECRWVLDGEGTATIKYDGSACAMLKGVLYRRHQHKAERGDPPQGWVHWTLSPNQRSGHGWLPCSVQFPADRYHMAAAYQLWKGSEGEIPDGTYELVGPKVQGNPYGLFVHELWKHGDARVVIDSADFEWLQGFFEDGQEPMEGIVWHHPDGRMAKVKARDFGVAWPR